MQTKLFESKNDVMTQEEYDIFYKILNLLEERGHPKYADRLENYDLHIVELEDDPDFTAAISPNPLRPIIYVSRGFLIDESYFNQLDVLMRHELAHNLMMHETRMVTELNKNPAAKNNYNDLKTSKSFHELLNIVMDDEISNERYSISDKKLCRKLILNGVAIRGLITEDHEESWQKLSLEQMFDKATKQLSEIKKKIIEKRFEPKKRTDAWGEFYHPIETSALSLYSYTQIDNPSTCFGTAKNGAKGILKSSFFKNLSYEGQIFVKNIATELDKIPDNKKRLILSKIGQSDILDKFRIGSTAVCTPEDKLLCVEMLNYMLGNVAEKPTIKVERVYHDVEYIKSYRDTVNQNINNSELSLDDIQEILERCSQEGVIAGKTRYGTISEDEYIRQEGLRNNLGEEN